MKMFCNDFLDNNKSDFLVYNLLEIIRQDDDFTKIFYNNTFIEKEQLFGSYAHPKKICIEALLLGILYHVHKYPQKSEKADLLSIPERLKFRTVRFEGEQSLDFTADINFYENIITTAKLQVSADMEYKLDFKCDGELIPEFQKDGNIFLYGAGGIGKSTVLLNQTKSDKISFYFPLYNYREESYERLSLKNYWILVNILLKYHYQYEYNTYNTCCACEGEQIVLKQLNKLENILKNNPENLNPKFVILLDGLNEMSSELRTILEDELQYIADE